MKLLLDQGIGRLTVVHLATAGILAEHVGDLGLDRASDTVILETARQMQAVVVTLDADFHQILAMTQALRPSVIRIRIEGLKSEEMAKLLSDVVAQTETELLDGAVISVTPLSIRARTLPIGG